MSSYLTIGLMSGTSLDGVDICCVEFTGDVDTDIWGHRIVKAHTQPYDKYWVNALKDAPNLSGLDLIKLHVEYGHFLGRTVRRFIDQFGLKVQLVASHGHTIFHQPEYKITFQLGDGETMASYLPCPVVTNFRTKDVALGGQGAPLVPVGEKYLFSPFDMCMNLGGIGNITIDEKGFDICPCNMLLNYLAELHDPNIEFDSDGEIAANGEVIKCVLDELDSLVYYQKAPPKSLGREWFITQVLPILDSQNFSAKDLMRTSVEHITKQICDAISKYRKSVDADGEPLEMKSLLVTGGGALNVFLMDNIRERLLQMGVVITESDSDTVSFKEALIFAFLGLRCMLGLTNVSHEVTGSSSDSVSGSIHLPSSEVALSPHSMQLCKFGIRRRSSSLSGSDGLNVVPPHIIGSPSKD